MEAPRVYVYHLEGMDCADCARKVEDALKGLPGVVRAEVNFQTGKLYLHLEAPEAELEARRRVETLGYRLQSSSPKRLPGPWAWAMASGGLLLLALLFGRLWPFLSPYAYSLAALVGVLPLLARAFRQFRQNPFGIQTLVSLATLGALAIGAWAEAAVAVFLFLVGEGLEALSVAKARQALLGLGGLMPKRAYRLGPAGVEEVALEALGPGDLVRVPPGERVPADGVVLEGEAWVEEAAFTGEPLPRAKAPGERVYGGSLVVEGSLLVRMERLPKESFLWEMERLAEEALLRKTRMERLVDAFSRRYTPAVLLFAAFWALIPPLFRGDFSGHLYQALALLLIACPCALVLSVPAAVAAGVARGARLGVLFRNAAALERLARVRYLALDKTGTLTLGRPRLLRVEALLGTEEEALALAKAVAEASAHPLARAVRAAPGGVLGVRAQGHRAEPGFGAFAKVEGKEIGLVRPDGVPLPPSLQARVRALEEEGLSLSLLVREKEVVALLAFQDEPRPEVREVLSQVRALGIRPVLLTGDRKAAALALGQALGFSPAEVWGGLSPLDKLKRVEALADEGGVAMVGDGVNDAPALARATVGLAVMEGTEAALRASDVGLLSLSALPKAFWLSRRTLAVVGQNLALALGLKGVFFLTTLLGLTGLWPAVLSDTGATVLVTFNALRLLSLPLTGPLQGTRIGT